MKAQNFIFPFLLTLALLLFTAENQAQTQKRGDIFGEAVNDEFGRSVSMPDKNTLAVGAFDKRSSTLDSGYVQIYRWNGYAWKQKGLNIDNFVYSVSGRFGYSISMPDSNIVAIGAPEDGSFGNNFVYIYRWNGNAWVKKGEHIDGAAANGSFGRSVSMPDSNTVAIGVSGSNGHVRIYKWNGNKWEQKGIDIGGDATVEWSVHSVSMPDSNTVAIGIPPFNYRSVNNAGHVRIYDWNGSAWVQKGGDLDGEEINDRFGYSVSMPDANTLAIGAPGRDENAVNSGRVSIYRWNGTFWTQKGGYLDGAAADDFSGWSVSMPDSNIVAIGAPFNDENGTRSGHVRIYRWNDSAWVQKSTDIDGSAAGDQSGWSVSMPDANTVAIGAIFGRNYSNVKTGRVRVYSLCNQQSDTTIVVRTACDSLTWIDSITYTATTNSPTYTLVNALGCDSVIKLDLTIKSSTSIRQTITACDAFTWIDGLTYTSSNNTATHILTNAAGCDSVINLDLTINSSTSTVQTITACNTFTWIDNITYTSSTNEPTFTLTNSMGCDSVVNLNLTMNTLDTSITKNETSLIANQAGALYQWLNCDSSFSAISGAQNREFIPSNSGFYACAINLNGCIDTTACTELIVNTENEIFNCYKLYPNPFIAQLTIEACGIQANTSIKVMNIHGQVVLKRTVFMGKTVLYTKNWAKGVYLVQLTNSEGLDNTYKLVHQ